MASDTLIFKQFYVNMKQGFVLVVNGFRQIIEELQLGGVFTLCRIYQRPLFPTVILIKLVIYIYSTCQGYVQN